ncbi:hypothetical protein BCR39DRAFT_561926 [Naematelia encephala]|uniref:DNA polymerase n=1 Tax=Naematelia encephala TaxID=71784 RepID=A0A1Y2AM30_9TREE|nr:hypothetical protein BCR39DRAFT_561926 [Naematelia encephala]
MTTHFIPIVRRAVLSGPRIASWRYKSTGGANSNRISTKKTKPRQLGFNDLDEVSTLQSNSPTFHLDQLKQEDSSGYIHRTLPTSKLLETFREMMSLRSLNPLPNAPRDHGFKPALKAVELAALDGQDSVSISEILANLSPENDIVWGVIYQLLKHGLTPEIDALNDEQRAAVLFNRVHGFGRVKAQYFANAGARTVDDLLVDPDRQWGEKARKISPAELLALQHFAEMELMVPRNEIEQLRTLIDSAFKKADPQLSFEIVGSFRRGEALSSDIDVVVWHPSYTCREAATTKSKKKLEPDSLISRVKQALCSAGLLNEHMIFSQGERKIMALTQLPNSTGSVHRQIDIRLCPTTSLPYMLLGNTGDDELMKYLRVRALEKGWVLNEYGMAKRLRGHTIPTMEEGSGIVVSSEKEIFD